MSYPDDASPLVVYASINSVKNATSRAAKMTTHDRWSNVSFEKGDEMGFYSLGGNWIGDGSFNNQRLEYDGERFTDKESGVEFSPTTMKDIFMYYPYEPEMNNVGLKLRISRDDTIRSRCIDLLSSKEIQLQGGEDGKVALSGAFKHAFSELIIMRGEGFDSPPENRGSIDYQRITAVINEGYTHVKVNLTTEDGKWSCTPQLYYLDDGQSLSKDEAKRWDAWKGGNYGVTTDEEEGNKTNEGDKTDGMPAWYIIIPTPSSVEYIELYDNDGYLQRVTSLRLGNNSKSPESGWRYPMEITMKELLPTVNPYPIIPWEEGDNLTEERKSGINDETEFVQWVRDYNAYLKDKTDENKIKKLLQYGDKIVETDGNISWHFYVHADLDMDKYSSLLQEEDGETSNVAIISELNDVLDGISTTLVDRKFINHTIKNLSRTFIDKMTGKGVIQNFDFIEPAVRKEEGTEPIGIIVNEMNGTSVINCNIEFGELNHLGGGPAGMVAGSIKNGKVEDCALSGFLIAESTADGSGAKIVGETDANSTFQNNEVWDVVLENP